MILPAIDTLFCYSEGNGRNLHQKKLILENRNAYYVFPKQLKYIFFFLRMGSTRRKVTDELNTNPDILYIQ